MNDLDIKLAEPDLEALELARQIIIVLGTGYQQTTKIAAMVAASRAISFAAGLEECAQEMLRRFGKASMGQDLAEACRVLAARRPGDMTEPSKAALALAKELQLGLATGEMGRSDVALALDDFAQQARGKALETYEEIAQKVADDHYSAWAEVIVTRIRALKSKPAEEPTP